MKNSIFKILSLALFMGIVGCEKNLDGIEGGNGRGYASSAYMGNSEMTISMNRSSGGEGEIEPRLASLATKNETVTVSIDDFLEEYNNKNFSNYKLLPTSEVELYELENPTNISENGKITVTIKKGKISSKVGIKVKALNSEIYPLGIKYAIPFRIVASSVNQILSNNQTIVNFQRPVVTSVAHVQQGYAPKVILDPSIAETDEFSFQVYFMLDKFTAYQESNYNMSLISYNWYSRIHSGGVNLADTQVENFVKDVKIKEKTWYQVTYVHTKDHKVRIYLDGKLIRTYIRPNVTLKGGSKISILNPQMSYSAPHILREIRFWSRALTENQIKADLYNPIDPDTNGLIAYIPIDSKKNGYKDITKYNNVVEFYKATSKRATGIQDGPQFQTKVPYEEYGIDKWYNDVEFPEGKLNN